MVNYTEEMEEMEEMEECGHCSENIQDEEWRFCPWCGNPHEVRNG